LASEVPPSPLPSPDYASFTPDHSLGSGVADDGAALAQAGCNTAWSKIFGRAATCDQTRPTSKCYEVEIRPNITVNGTNVKWRPQLEANCFVRRGETIQLDFHWTVQSSQAGVLIDRSSQYFADADTFIINMRTEWGEHDCVRTVGTYDVVRFWWSVSGGGASSSATEPVDIYCN
jgi:hypothetical protein